MSDRQLGLGMATALVVGNTIGMGIFMQPAALAPFGLNALTGWAAVIFGCICLAGGLHGYFVASARLWERALLVAGALLLIAPEIYSSLLGLALVGVVAAVQLQRRRKPFDPALGAKKPG